MKPTWNTWKDLPANVEQNDLNTAKHEEWRHISSGLKTRDPNNECHTLHKLYHLVKLYNQYQVI